MESTADSPAKPRLAHAFTPANAAEMARKAHTAREQRKISEKAELEAARAKEAEAIANAPTPDEAYRLARLLRTRAQIEMLDKQLEKCDEPKDLKAIADAIGRLSDLLFALSGWSKPGLTRPSSKKPAKPEATGPIE